MPTPERPRDVAYISVRNWRRFQHYTDRNPPWIKNYTDLLKDDAYLDLSSHRRAILHGLWLVYASVKARPRLDARSLSRRLEMKVTRADIEALISAGFIEFTDSPEIEEPKWASRYVSSETRERVLDRFGRQCAMCHSPDDLEIDHVLPISKGGTSDEANLRALCRPCNRRLHNSESVQHLSSISLASVPPETEKETETPLPPLRENPKSNGRAPKRTGYRLVRGTHGISYVRDPNGVDRLPAGYQP